MPGPARRRTTHSLESVVDGAVAMLDREGLGGLTFRGLAGELGGGVGSIYHYVSGKDELVALAIDRVLEDVLADVAAMRAGRLDPADVHADGPGPDHPRPEVAAALLEVRRVMLTLFWHMERHPWMAPQLQLEGGLQRGSLRLLDEVGQQLARTGTTPLQQFHGATALINYVTGVGAEMDYRDHRVQGGAMPDGPDEQTRRDAFFDRWIGEAGPELPFIASIGEILRDHDDFAQFVGGLDLLLVGLRDQAPA